MSLYKRNSLSNVSLRIKPVSEYIVGGPLDLQAVGISEMDFYFSLIFHFQQQETVRGPLLRSTSCRMEQTAATKNVHSAIMERQLLHHRDYW